MKLSANLRNRAANWHPGWIALLGGLSAFGCYACMYAFRKAFSAGTFDRDPFFGINYKVCLVIAQMIGYIFSKLYGIKFISQRGKNNRAKYILLLIGISWLSLWGFAIIPAPYNIIFLLLNGFPLGLVWGLVFSYLEGRQTTEFMGAMMSVSLIFASGFVKTVARNLMQHTGISEYWMPVFTGAIFIIPLLLFVFCLEMMPEPSKEDKMLRTERVPMNLAERTSFVLTFLPGIILTLAIYVLLTCMRDIRDNFEVEIWDGLGIHNNSIYTKIDTFISIAVLVMMAFLILIKDNFKAFSIIHGMIITGCLLIGLGTLLFNKAYIGPVAWMGLLGLGLYMAYVPYNAIFFERMIACFNYKSNIGFLMYLADSIGYLGSFSILLFHEFGSTAIGWTIFFKDSLMVVSCLGALLGLLSLFYFRNKAYLTTTKRSLTVEK
ncbi:DUF5690 family protein [Chitinophaga sp. 30R24]|uniref:DUF5690 family protein n=1 Tax=Chitinophaga sp. 30R24 TaxID=3248838 RepID=UPI003B8F5FB3